jgi:hypothetical protein
MTGKEVNLNGLNFDFKVTYKCIEMELHDEEK